MQKTHILNCCVLCWLSFSAFVFFKNLCNILNPCFILYHHFNPYPELHFKKSKSGRQVGFGTGLNWEPPQSCVQSLTGQETQILNRGASDASTVDTCVGQDCNIPRAETHLRLFLHRPMTHRCRKHHTGFIFDITGFQ